MKNHPQSGQPKHKLDKWTLDFPNVQPLLFKLHRGKGLHFFKYEVVK